MKSLTHFNLDVEILKEFHKIFPVGKRSPFVNELLKTYLEEIKKSPEGVSIPSGHTENSRLVSGEVSND